MRTISWRIVDVQRRGLYERSATRRDSQGESGDVFADGACWS